MPPKIVRTPKDFPLDTITRGDSQNYNKFFTDFINGVEESANRSPIQRIRDVTPPEIFDGRKQWAQYLSPVKNQGNCGGCYAFAAVSALADRYNLLSQGALHLNLSANKVVTCDVIGAEIYIYGASDFKHLSTFNEAQKEYGCFGNTLLEAWRYLHSVGTNTVECVPENPDVQICSDLVGKYYDVCANGEPAVFYRTEHVYVVAGVPKDGGSEMSIRRNIFFHGPVSTAMDIYEDFYTFDPSKEIYMHRTGKRVGGHSIVIDGWGEENGTKFWWVRNSWGKEWGIGGYFKLMRGMNCCSCEENVIVGAPALEPLGQLDQAEYAVDLLNVPAESNIRRVRTSTFTEYGGIDPRTQISNRERSYAQYNNYPLFRRPLPIEPGAFVAGYIGARAEKGASAPQNTTISPRSTFYIAIGLALVVFFLVVFLAK